MDIFGAPSLTDLARLATRLASTYFLLLVVARLLGRRMPEPENRDVTLGAILGGLVAPALVRAEDAPLGALMGIVLLFCLNVLMSRLAYRFPWVDRLLFGPPRVLVAHGQLNQRELIREKIRRSELTSIVESKGVHSLAEVDPSSSTPRVA
jgi:uncharacterized membrane protein YcaP (DUF421 family)